jgi:quercetin dioxygenase-like cupin family protein
MRLNLSFAGACVACSMAASQPAPVAAVRAGAQGVTLIGKSAEVPEVLVVSIEGHPVQGHLALKALMRAEHMTVLELHYQAGAKAPIHTHSHESVIYVVSGRVKTWIGDGVYVLGPGDVARHPAGVPHAVEALADSTVLEVKSPPPDVSRLIGTTKD